MGWIKPGFHLLSIYRWLLLDFIYLINVTMPMSSLSFFDDWWLRWWFICRCCRRRLRHAAPPKAFLWCFYAPLPRWWRAADDAAAPRGYYDGWWCRWCARRWCHYWCAITPLPLLIIDADWFFIIIFIIFAAISRHYLFWLRIILLIIFILLRWRCHYFTLIDAIWLGMDRDFHSILFFIRLEGVWER